MNLFRPACGKPALLFFSVAVILLLLASSRVMAEPWPIKHFEVVNVEPGGQGSTGGTAGEILGAIGRAARELGIDPDATGGLKTITLLPKTKTDIETVLRLAATQMEHWGFTPPALEPVVVTMPDGIKRYRVYLAAKGASGRYHRNPCDTLFRDERVIALDAEKVLDNGSLGIKGIYVLLHELFHAVQYGSPFFNHCDDNPVGSWITEGQADAVSWAITRQLRESAYKNLLEDITPNNHKNRASVWGLRNYSNRLPVPEDIKESYRTSSLWRFLSEVNASGVDVATMPGIHSFDFSYLSRLLQTGLSERDCSTSGAPCAAEVQWLDSGLRSQFGKPLRELYTRFMQAYSLYGDGRLIGSTVPDEKWLDGSFTYMDGARKYKGCKTVSLSPTPDSLQQTMVIPRFKELSTQCWEVDLEGFDESHLSIAITTKLPAAAPPQPRLEQLTAALVDNSRTMDRAKVEPAAPDEPRRATWVYRFENNKKTEFLLTNVAKDAEATRALPNLEVTFTVLREYASMSASESGSGPSPANIDTPLPIEFDSLHGYVYPYSYRRIDDQYVGIDNMQGLTEPCFIKLGLLRNTENGDQIAFQMNHEGPITAGDYVFAANNKKHPDEVHGGFVGGFSIGAGNPLSGGRQQDFYIDSGNVTIDSVSGGLVRGHMEANGVRRNPYSGPKAFEKWGHLNLTIDMKFSILMKNPAGKPYSNTPYACLQQTSPGAGPGGSRRSSATASPGQGATPPTNAKTPTGKDSPGSDGPASPMPPDETAAAAVPATDAAAAPGVTGQPASSSDSGGNLPQPYVRRLVLRTTGGVESEVIFVDDNFKITGGCNGTTPISLGFYRGQP
ncbi:MAG TPA: hypothetical protein DCO71_02500, partial [Gammaproteobacteria bacterium]|nr:hypothetical protein [Gammaproteobacteria bacterium]